MKSGLWLSRHIERPEPYWDGCFSTLLSLAAASPLNSLSRPCHGARMSAVDVPSRPSWMTEDVVLLQEQARRFIKPNTSRTWSAGTKRAV